MRKEASRRFGKGDWIMAIVVPVITVMAIVAGNTYLMNQPARAAAYADYVALLHATEIQKTLHDPSLPSEQAAQRAMAMIEEALSSFESPYARERKNHPISMQTLEAIAPRIIELQRQGENLESYVLQDGKIVPLTFN